MTATGLRIIRFVLSIGLAAMATREPAFLAQAPAEPAVTVGLGEGAAPPGSAAVVPLTLSAPDGIAVGRLSVKVRVPTGELAFGKIDPSGLAVGVGAKVTAETRAAGNGVTELSIEILAGADGARAGAALPPGPVAYLTFTVSEKASSGTDVPLTLEATVTSAGAPPRDIAPVGRKAGTVTVSEPPVPACFFYMH